MKKFLSLLVLNYLRFFARRKLSKINPIIIGVTGSAGKSSCVAAIEAILKEKYIVKSTAGANSESGIPLSILDLKMTDYSFLDWLRVLLLAPSSSLLAASHYDVLVCEMGIDSLTPPKNMGYLLSIIQPKVGVFLNAFPVHTEQMKSIEKIAAEKGKLIKSLPKDGFAILNTDDPQVIPFAKKTKAKVLTFGKNKTADINVSGLNYSLTSDYNYTLAAAIAVAKALGIPSTTSYKLLATSFVPPPGRWSLFPGINDSHLIDSSYNASPETVNDALKTLHSKKAIRHIAVLGDMRELGELAEKSHQEVAAAAYRLADKIITVGPLCKNYFPPSPKLINQFDNSRQAGIFLQTFTQPGDLILFKGSQNTIFLEAAVEMCLANKEDSSKLCRRGEFWDRERARYQEP